MAVYTALDERVLARWLAGHAVGDLVECHGIPSGIENSNFFVTTEKDGRPERFVLTIFERLGFDELPWYLSLMEHLAAHGVAAPRPIPDRDGALCSRLEEKPAALVTRLSGHSVTDPSPAHCALVGRALAGLHLAGRDFAVPRDNPRGLSWWRKTAVDVAGFLDADQRALLHDEIAVQVERWQATTDALPRGPIHADLFRDNALFVDAADGDAGPSLGGIIDFYFAGVDAWILDLAICVNDWCIDRATGTLDRPRHAALMDAYRDARALSPHEEDAFALALRAAALRFWLSRLEDLHRPRPAQLLTPHDPTHFERVLRARRRDAH